MACSCMYISSEGTGLYTEAVSEFPIKLWQEVYEKSHGQSSQAIFSHRNEKVTTEIKT